MCIGDIVIIDRQPPHIGSVTEGGMILCEDGTTLPIDEHTSLLYTALDVIKQLERGVLESHETR